MKVQQGLDILIVDDWLDAAESLAELIRLWGFEARAVYSGPAALKAARQKPPDVVIMDIGMPRMDGFETARRLREEHPDHPIVLVAVTGHGIESAYIAAISATFDHHLVKPTHSEKILKLLCSLRESRS